MRHAVSLGQSEADRLAGEAERQQRLEYLRAQVARLRARLATAREEYEARRLSLDEEIALVRSIERELIAARTEFRDLSAEP